jgi:hypothetical protein
MKVLITRSCIFLMILASDFSPLTVIVNATMFCTLAIVYSCLDI